MMLFGVAGLCCCRCLLFVVYCSLSLVDGCCCLLFPSCWLLYVDCCDCLASFSASVIRCLLLRCVLVVLSRCVLLVFG